MIVADLLKLLANLGEVLEASGAKSVAMELADVSEKMKPFGKYKLKAFADFLVKAAAPPDAHSTTKPPTSRKKAEADPEQVQRALDALRGLYHRALEPDVTVEFIQAEVIRLTDLKKDQLEDLARQFEISRKFKNKGEIVKAIAQRIIDRKGAFERAQA